MRLDYRYRKTKKIKDCFQRLEIARKVIDLLPQLPHIERNLRRQSLLKSSLFSARIEGNKLDYEDIRFASERSKTKNLEKIEVFNILDALRWLYSPQSLKKLSKGFILRLHKIVMRDISPSPGVFRKEASAIFNQAGIAVYVPPPPNEIFQLIEKLISCINSSSTPPSIKAALFHFTFEKIHPFLDGNGRVGRLLSTFILKQDRFDFRGLVSLEEYFEKNRQLYYDLPAITKTDITRFVEFFLEGLAEQAEKTIADLKDIKEERPEDTLLPRRGEILAIIRDHEMVSFDFIKRRFFKVPDSTLHYDLRRLMEKGLIKKLGSTRAVRYAPK